VSAIERAQKSKAAFGSKCTHVHKCRPELVERCRMFVEWDFASAGPCRTARASGANAGVAPATLTGGFLDMIVQRLLAVLLVAASYGAIAVAAEPLPANIAASAADPDRGKDQAAMDAQRHGPEILAFAGVSSGAKIVDLIPGGGYWTRLFAKSVGPTGHVYAIWPSEYLKVDGEEVAPYRAVAAKYPNVSVLEQPAAKLAAPEKVDLVFTVQNYHDYLDPFMGPTDPMVLNKAVFAALKPGGIYLIVDHVAAAGSGARDTDTLHRIDPALVKAQVTAAGFAYVGECPLLANPADDHTKKVFDAAIRGHTDQFIYKFKKPG
jgi:predicted methyltransferase